MVDVNLFLKIIGVMREIIFQMVASWDGYRSARGERGIGGHVSWGAKIFRLRRAQYEKKTSTAF